MIAYDKFGREIKPGDYVVYGAGRGKIQIGIVTRLREYKAWRDEDAVKVGVRGIDRWTYRGLVVQREGWLLESKNTVVVLDANTVPQDYKDVLNVSNG